MNNKQTNNHAPNPSETDAPELSETAQNFQKIMREGFHEHMNLVRPIRIQIGLDLGTSYSKVAWRFGKNSYPVCFGNKKNSMSNYLVPSVIGLKGDLMLIAPPQEKENQTNSFHTISNFKICLACESEENNICSIRQCQLSNWKDGLLPEDIEPHAAIFFTAFYLAKLITRTKIIIGQELQNLTLPRDVSIKWLINLAVPDRYIDQSPIAKAFEEALDTAWLMAEVFSQQLVTNNKNEIIECFLAARELRCELKSENEVFDCFVYPEVGAEVASIVLDPTSEEGLYAFVDVGAGTVDASIFRFFRDDGESQRPPYAANVYHLGAARIEEISNQRFKMISLSWLKALKESHKRDLISDGNSLLSPVNEIIDEAKKEIGIRTETELTKTFKEAYRKENNFDRWTNLTLIVGGGGASIPSYQQAAKHAFTLKSADFTGEREPHIKVLPVPSDFDIGTLPIMHFHRFAVAYGLSHEIINLPLIVLPHEVTPIMKLRTKEYIDQTIDG